MARLMQSINQLIKSSSSTLLVTIVAILTLPTSWANAQENVNPADQGTAEPSSEEIDIAGLETITAGLTPIHSWKPATYSYKFKTAAVCHDSLNDKYGIVAVFRRTTNGINFYDSVYYLRIEGNSASPSYGDMVSGIWLDSVNLINNYGIENVDCTTNNSSSVFVVYDKAGSDARWWRFVGTTSYGPYSVTTVSCRAGSLYSHLPKIAYTSTSSRIEIMFDGFDYSTGGQTSQACLKNFEAYTGNPGHEEFVWGESQTRAGHDIEWNGLNKFIAIMTWVADAGSPTYYTRLRYDYLGYYEAYSYSTIDERPIGDVSDGRVQLVYTAGNKNSGHLFVMQSPKYTYWLTQQGDIFIDPYDPDPNPYDHGTNFMKFTTCEYWGDLDRIAHTYHDLFYFYPGPPPITIRRTVHYQWYIAVEPPLESYGLNNGYYPEACNAADTTTDDEVLLVSSRAPNGNDTMYWNIEPQD